MKLTKTAALPGGELINSYGGALTKLETAALKTMERIHKREVTRGIIADITSNLPMTGNFDLYLNVRWRYHSDGESCEVVVRRRDA